MKEKTVGYVSTKHEEEFSVIALIHNESNSLVIIQWIYEAL